MQQFSFAFCVFVEVMPVYWHAVIIKKVIKPEKRDSNLAQIVKQLLLAAQTDYRHAGSSLSQFKFRQLQFRKVHLPFVICKNFHFILDAFDFFCVIYQALYQLLRFVSKGKYLVQSIEIKNQLEHLFCCKMIDKRVICTRRKFKFIEFEVI